MSWDRAAAAKALALELANAALINPQTPTPASIFDHPPSTINPPAIVIGWPTVRYSIIAPTIDEAILPVLCVGPVGGDDQVAELLAWVRHAVTDATLGGTVQIAYPSGELNWRQQNVAGVDVLAAELTFNIQM